MNTTISIQTTIETKTKAQKLAERLGVSLNTVIDRYLKMFIKTKGADVREEPSEYLIKSLKQSEKDIKAGRVKSFENGKAALDYINSLIKHDKQNKSKTI